MFSPTSIWIRNPSRHALDVASVRQRIMSGPGPCFPCTARGGEGVGSFCFKFQLFYATAIVLDSWSQCSGAAYPSAHVQLRPRRPHSPRRLRSPTAHAAPIVAAGMSIGAPSALPSPFYRVFMIHHRGPVVLCRGCSMISDRKPHRTRRWFRVLDSTSHRWANPIIWFWEKPICIYMYVYPISSGSLHR